MTKKKLTLILLFISLMIGFSCKNESNEDSIILTGDSIAADWDIQQYLPTKRIINKGVPGAVINDIMDWKLDSKGKTITLLVGTNNISSLVDYDSFPEEFNDSFIHSYVEVIHSLKAKKIIVISILPRDYSKNPNLFNQEIKKLNNQLKDSLLSCNNVYFLDVFDYFLKDGNINYEYSVDGLHLNNYGYELLSKLLAKEL